ncbi:MAG: T9SS type A sorting domain-containing protein [Ignavibacteriales bacterium]|nr:T9SS type A sorting domain-containing protein [Ignavibacteriales bacterium]
MRKRLFFGIFLISATLFAGDPGKVTAIDLENALAARHPVETPFGIIVTDNAASSLALVTPTGTIQLAAAPGIGGYVSYSPDRSTIGVKYITADEKQSPALIDLATGKIRYLAEPQEQCGEVSFSNGGKIAYTIGNDLIVRNGNTTTSYPLGTYANLAPISPDGNYAAFNNCDDQIFILKLATGEKEQLTSLPRGYFQPFWSPDGTKLLYSSLGGDLFVYNTANRQTTSLDNGISPSWSPDGTTILYTRTITNQERLVNSDIWSCRADGSARKQVTATADAFETDASFSLDGNTILYAHVGQNIVKKQSIAAPNNSIDQAPNAFFRPSLAPLQSPLRSVKAPILDTINLPYVNQTYDTPDWHSGGSSCAPTAASMVLAYYNILPPWNIWVSWPSPGHYSPYGNYVADIYAYLKTSYIYSAMDASDVKSAWGGYGYMWSTGSPHTRMAGYYTNHGVSSVQSEMPPYSEATDEIYAGRPYTLCVGLTTAGHLIIARGIYTDHTLIFNDPYGNKNSGGSYKSPYGRGMTYDWPGYANGYANLNTVWWCIRTQYVPPPATDTLVDDTPFYKGFYLNYFAPATFAMWQERTTSGWDNHFWFVKTKGSKTVDTCYATWQPTLQREGSYELFAYIPFSNSTASRYKIKYRNGDTLRILNQKLYRNDWMSLGTYGFNKGNTGSVRLGDQSDSAGQEIVFDAIRWSYRGPLASPVVAVASGTPCTFELSPAFPNPFNPSTQIEFSLPTESFAAVKIFDALGREQETLLSQILSAGTYRVDWNAGNHPSGVYFCRLQTGRSMQTIKLVLQK